MEEDYLIGMIVFNRHDCFNNHDCFYNNHKLSSLLGLESL